ncbi:hypothetical protein C8J57DRAFT_1540028 [Mycena rebaudengoi]|nr:hypothetical protein C8J57DRAFT_1540028 [Mycena rebaudengoi]
MAVDANYSSDLEHNSVPVQPDADSDSPCLAQIPLTADNSPSIVPSTQTSANALVSKGLRIKITCQLKVDNLLYFTTVPPTFDVPRTPTAILLDLSGSCHLLKKADSSFMSVDRFIRNENQESWDGSGAHTKGDAWVHNFTSNPNEKFKCRHHTLTCNGVDKCQFLDPELFSGLERFEADENAMRELWNHELDQNEAEAASPSGIIARFYNRIHSSKCKIQCDGVPVLVRLTHASSAYGKQYFIGCSKWKRSETGSHLYWPMPPNVDEDVLRFVMENEGCLPTGPEEMNNRCILTVHPRVGLTHCPYSHIIGGKIMPAKIEHRLCPSRMIIYVPVEDLPATRHKAIVVLENPHNHPMHPMSKPGAEDKLKLKTAVNAVGLNGLTVQKLLNGVLYHLNTREAKLPKSERYIHTAMSKNGFRLVVTMHPQIVALIHKILSLNFDFTFKRVEGKMDEWEVVGLVDRVKKRYTLASLFCDSKNTQAFAQLFTEFFDAIHHVTGEQFKLAPFYPDARCRTVMLDGEVPQALGFGAFLATYNNPEVSQIWTSNPVKLLSKCLKTCCLHFERHIDELPQHIPKPVIVRLKSVMGLDTQEEIDEWHEFCGAQADPEIKNWYAHKIANPWILPSINKFLSQISGEDWDITPNHSNYVESAHAARNAETGIHMPLLTAILKSQECDNIKAQDLVLLERDGMIQKRWNGNAEREKLAAQRKIRAARKAADRNDQITSYETLKAERDAIAEDNKASLERQKTLEAEIKSVQEQMKLDRHRSDLKEHVIAIRRDVDDEKSLRREWNIRRAEIIKDLEQLRKGGLAGARLKGRRPSERPSGDGTSSPPTVDLGPIDTGASTSGPHYDVESLGSEGDLFWEPELGTTHVATVHDPAGAGDQIYVDHVNTLNTFIPAENCSTVNQTELYTTFGHSILNFDSISPDLNNHSPESQDIPSHDTGLEYIAAPIDILNQSGSRASQELPPLPTPSLDPSLSPSPAELEEPVNNLVNGGPDHTIAPRDIDLDLNERNIISGKRQRTQSTRAADAAVSRPAKRGLCAR